MRNITVNIVIMCIYLISLAGCNPSTDISPTSSEIISKEIAVTDTLIPSSTITATITPSNTPIPSKTLKPTITPTVHPTDTPIFDAFGIITRTPDPPAQCPLESSNLVPDLSTLFNLNGWKLYEQAILDFLNAGGTPQAIISTFLQETGWFEEDLAIQQDITGDNVFEFIFSDKRIVRVFGCENGKYQTLLRYTEDSVGFLRAIRVSAPGDMNLNGVSELITNAQHGTMNAEHLVTIFEWNGEQLESVIQGESYSDGKYSSSAAMSGVTQVSTNDIDGNGTLELVLVGSPPIETTSAYDGLPWRTETHVYSWNGDQFLLHRVIFSPPEFRFQAVQDGDKAFLVGDYDQANEFYQQVISNDMLEWWSEDRWSYEIRSLSIQASETPLSTPIPDLTEYPNLAAYARFRSLLLHIVRGNIAEAENEFNILKEKFLPGQPGYAYVELATSFWDEYQEVANIEDACTKAIEYADLHSVEILSFLGNGEHARAYFGNQSLDYEPEDVCPFR